MYGREPAQGMDRPFQRQGLWLMSPAPGEGSNDFPILARVGNTRCRPPPWRTPVDAAGRGNVACPPHGDEGGCAGAVLGGGGDPVCAAVRAWDPGDAGPELAGRPRLLSGYRPGAELCGWAPAGRPVLPGRVALVQPAGPRAGGRALEDHGGSSAHGVRAGRGVPEHPRSDPLCRAGGTVLRFAGRRRRPDGLPLSRPAGTDGRRALLFTLALQQQLRSGALLPHAARVPQPGRRALAPVPPDRPAAGTDVPRSHRPLPRPLRPLHGRVRSSRHTRPTGGTRTVRASLRNGRAGRDAAARFHRRALPPGDPEPGADALGVVVGELAGAPAADRSLHVVSLRGARPALGRRAARGSVEAWKRGSVEAWKRGSVGGRRVGRWRPGPARLRVRGHDLGMADGGAATPPGVLPEGRAAAADRVWRLRSLVVDRAVDRAGRTPGFDPGGGHPAADAVGRDGRRRAPGPAGGPAFVRKARCLPESRGHRGVHRPERARRLPLDAPCPAFGRRGALHRRPGVDGCRAGRGKGGGARGAVQQPLRRPAPASAGPGGDVRGARAGRRGRLRGAGRRVLGDLRPLGGSGRARVRPPAVP